MRNVWQQEKNGNAENVGTILPVLQVIYQVQAATVLQVEVTYGLEFRQEVQDLVTGNVFIAEKIQQALQVHGQVLVKAAQ